jgi:SAM-dependent methyltransferase
MIASVTDDSTHRFSNRADDYSRFRPDYPAALLEHLCARCGLGPDCVVADIGAGTGILSRQLLPLAARVFAIEPNLAMRSLAESLLGEDDRYHSLPSCAEDSLLADASIDLVTVAQAFHWFERAAFRRECQRILRPGGLVALIWNERELLADPVAGAYEAILQHHARPLPRVTHQQIDESAMRAFFGGGHYHRAAFANHQELDFEGLLGRMRSSSYAPSKGSAEYFPMVHELEELHADFADERGLVCLRYSCNCYSGALAP